MRCSVLALFLVGSASAFVSTQTSSARMSALSATAESTADVRQTIKRLTTDNFQESLDSMEPFLTQQAGRTFLTKSLNRLQYKAQELGMDVPADFAKDAKCMAARRAKQDAFIQAKEEERLAAEAEAAEAAADEAEEQAEESAEEEAAPVEEPELVEA